VRKFKIFPSPCGRGLRGGVEKLLPPPNPPRKGEGNIFSISFSNNFEF